jgi:L-2,4-diaminobutyric acid acetyltransferase
MKISYRHPTLEDGSAVYSLIKSCPPLDINSQYYYHIICSDFSQTCVVAEYDKKIIGFLSAYLKPEQADCLFAWQMAVATEARGRKVALNMLEWLTKQSKCTNVNTLETTISPSNQASQNIFKLFAKQHNANCQTFTFLEASHFDYNSHEDEILYKISPLNFKTN